MLIQILLSSAIVPLITGMALVLLFWGNSGRNRHSKALWPASLSLALSFLAAWMLIRGVPKWPVPDSLGWSPFLLLGGLLLGVFCSYQKLPLPTISAIRLLACAAVIVLAGSNLIKYSWKDQAWLWVLGLALLLNLLWHMLENIAVRRTGLIAAAVFSAVFGALAIGALLGESVIICQFAAAVSAGFAGIFLAALLRRDIDLSQATLFVAMPLYGLFLLNSYFYANLGWSGLALVLSVIPVSLLVSRSMSGRAAKHRMS